MRVAQLGKSDLPAMMPQEEAIFPPRASFAAQDHGRASVHSARWWAGRASIECQHAKSDCLVRDERGVTTIELAFMLPVFSVVLIAMLDLGILVHSEMDLRNAARVGAQYAFQDANDTATIASTAINALGPAGSTASAAAALSCECPTSTTDYSQTTAVSCTVTTCAVTSSKPATYVTVTMQQPYTPLLGSWGLVQSRTMTSTAIMRVN
jgi:Flp pilus assembly protein TadG